MKYAQEISAATQEIFSTMIMLEVSSAEPFNRTDSTLENSVTGIVGLAGETKGMLAIHLPEKTAMAVTTAFLGMDVDTVDEDVCDAIGELANMLGGSLKATIDPSGGSVQLSMPSTIHGQEYTIDCLADAKSITVPFSFADHTFTVELQISA